MKIYGFTDNEEALGNIADWDTAIKGFGIKAKHIIDLNKNLKLVCNMGGKQFEYEPRIALKRDGELTHIICGQFFICKFDDAGKLVDVENSDVPFIEECLARFPKEHLQLYYIYYLKKHNLVKYARAYAPVRRALFACYDEFWSGNAVYHALLPEVFGQKVLECTLGSNR